MNKLYILRGGFEFFCAGFAEMGKMFLVNTKKINKSEDKLWYNG